MVWQTEKGDGHTSPAPEAQCLSPLQRRTLAALIDAFMPPLDEAQTSQVLASANLRTERASFAEGFLAARGAQPCAVAAVEGAFALKLTAPERTEAKLLLSALSTRVGTALVLFASPLRPAFVDQPIAERERGLQFLARSPLGVHNKAFLGLKRLLLGTCLSAVDPEGNNAFWPAMGYSPFAQERPPQPPPSAVKGRAAFEAKILTLEKDTEITVDVVVIGSGAGGGVAAAALSAAGYTVLVLEKGPYVPPAKVTTLEIDAFEHMYEKGGVLTTADGAIAILAGSTMGGGTTVNWACCIPTPPYVREEWAAPSGEHRLPQFAPGAEEYGVAEAAVSARIGATEEGVTHNKANRILLDGAKAMGYAAKTAAQNFRVPDDEGAGWSCFGDRDENKQGTLVTYLLDAAETGRCHFIEGCCVEKIDFETAHRPAPQQRRASGVTARVPRTGGGGHWELNVTARRCVVLSAGSLHSPCVLLRSGLSNDHIGKHLHLHPVTGAVGVFEGEGVEAYRGAPMTAVCNGAEAGPKGDFYGSKIEVPSVHPGLVSACLPWVSGADFKASLLKVMDTLALIVLTRDRGGGRVVLPPSPPWYKTGCIPWYQTGRGRCSVPDAAPTVHYTISPADSAAMLHGLDHAFRILAAAGATSICSLHSARLLRCELPPGGAAGKGREEEVECFLKKVAKAGTLGNTLGLFSAHQMGSCRMGHSPLTSVVDCDGESWERDDLYVLDASVFPTASGANPMLTTLSIAQMLATRLVRRLEAEDAAAPGAIREGTPLLEVRQARRNRAREEEAKRKRGRVVVVAACVGAVLAALVAVGAAVALGKANADS